jgi:hypothetical protein
MRVRCLSFLFLLWYCMYRNIYSIWSMRQAQPIDAQQRVLVFQMRRLRDDISGTAPGSKRCSQACERR